MARAVSRSTIRGQDPQTWRQVSLHGGIRGLSEWASTSGVARAFSARAFLIRGMATLEDLGHMPTKVPRAGNAFLKASNIIS